LCSLPARCSVAEFRGRAGRLAFDATSAIRGLTFHESFARISARRFVAVLRGPADLSAPKHDLGHPWPGLPPRPILLNVLYHVWFEEKLHAARRHSSRTCCPETDLGLNRGL
jgi:hypothetical protein